ncbi:hypothetical protein SAMN05444158_2098 [Bradyrhizobium canariense]|uniref:DUF2474 domain-containing protein n=1 Tax=Bradyrhizobium canariense TaxID=255045 RepID=A0A1H1SB15_9BRAD|nr:DUF2474 domain-containing protein [Bradyrhizobium canariense]SDS45154.1 hypothetical protein SAMN05444158_2098 [Bradyrhizobium canariense]
MASRQSQHSLKQRLSWFGVLWLGGVGAVAMTSLVLRLWIVPN